MISRDWLIEEIKKEQDLSIMDYSSNLDDCKSQFEISVLDTESLANAINAMYLFQGVTGVTNNEIQRYKNAQNSGFFTYKKVFCLNNSASYFKIYLVSKV